MGAARTGPNLPKGHAHLDFSITGHVDHHHTQSAHPREKTSNLGIFAWTTPRAKGWLSPPPPHPLDPCPSLCWLCPNHAQIDIMIMLQVSCKEPVRPGALLRCSQHVHVLRKPVRVHVLAIGSNALPTFAIFSQEHFTEYLLYPCHNLAHKFCIVDLLWVVSHNALGTSHHFPCVLCVHALPTFTCISCTHLHFNFGLDAHAHESRVVRCGAPKLMCAALGLRIYRTFFTFFQYLFLVWNLFLPMP